jgi:hypothetical protein
MLGFDAESGKQIILFLMIWSLFAGIGIVIGRRKGVSPAVAILGSFPLWCAIFALWLVKQPDLPSQ